MEARLAKIIKVISGGQTGADTGGLVAARKLGIPTGGYAPKGWMTEIGPLEKELRSFGLVESHGGYPERTLENIQAADFTILIADKLDRGSGLTVRRCEAAHCPCWLIKPDDERIDPDPIKVRFSWADEGIVLNVAGNRESRSKGIGYKTAALIEKFLIEFNGGSK